MFSTLNNMMSSPLNSKAVSLLNMDTLADRLRWALAQAGMKPAHLAKNAKISRGTISLWLSGTTKRAGGDNLARAARELKVDLNWLTTGVGSPIADYAHLARFHAGVLEEIYGPVGPDPVANAEQWLAERRARYPSGEFVLAYFAYPTLHDPIPLDAGGISSNARAARILTIPR